MGFSGARSGASSKGETVAIPAFTKFDPHAFLESEKRGGAPAKPAKVAKVDKAEAERGATLASLATLAGGLPQNHNSEPAAEPWTDAHDERAAIIERDDGAPRAWAEALVRLD